MPRSILETRPRFDDRSSFWNQGPVKMSGFRFKGPESSSDVSGSSLDVRVEVVRCQSFLSAEGTEGLALTSGSRICSPGINCSDLRLVGVIHTSYFRLQSYFTFISIPTSSSSCSSSSTVLNVRFKKSTTAASYFAGCFRRCCTCADPENLGGSLVTDPTDKFHHLVAENLAPSLLRFSSTSLSRYFWGR